MPTFGIDETQNPRRGPGGGNNPMTAAAGGITPKQIQGGIPGRAPTVAPGQPAQAQHGGPRLPDFSKGMSEGLPGMGGGAGGGAAVGEAGAEFGLTTTGDESIEELQEALGYLRAATAQELVELPNDDQPEDA
jgi:hypothetical protein